MRKTILDLFGLELICSKRTAIAIAVLLSTALTACITQDTPSDVETDSQTTILMTLKKALTFHASFNNGLDADFSLGDKKIYTAPSYDELEKTKSGIHNPEIILTAGKNNHGSALKFQNKNKSALFYRAENNVAFSDQNWSGTLSFWMKLIPGEDLEHDYCDPVQVTDKSYNNSAIWIDLSADCSPGQIRLGAFGILDSWNPGNIPNDKNPDFQKHLVVVENPPLKNDAWTHVLITYLNLGSSAGGTTGLYLDGIFQGQTDLIKEPFEWNLAKGTLRLGVNYAGFLDEISVFNRPLINREIGELYQLELGASVLHP